MIKGSRVYLFGIGGYGCGPIWGQIYRVVVFFPTIDCYRGWKGIEVLGWIEALLEE